MTATKITRTQAERTLKAVRRRFASYLDPMVIDGVTYPANGVEPTLMEDFDRPGWTIMWEEGPSDWTYHLDGSPSEEDYCLAAEFGAKPYQHAETKIPKGVWVESITSYSLGLYPA